MKYCFKLDIFNKFLLNIVKEEINDDKVLENIKNEYKNIILRAKDIGSNNMLLSSYALAAFFIAMNRESNLDTLKNYEILYNGLKHSKILKIFLGNSKSYFSEKKMKIRRKWSKETYKKKYENDWIVDVLEKTDNYEFGLNYKACGVCKLCKDENCFELAKYLCKLDFMLVEIIGIRLNRTKTIAEGYELCDFRFIKNK